MKVEGEGCYMHCMNRITGSVGETWLTDVEKEHGFRLIESLCTYYLLEVISVAWMDNHFHIVVYAPGQKPTLEEAASRYNTYYEKKSPIDAITDRSRCEKVAEEMIDISNFMKIFQQRFSSYINRVRKRRGTLWADRFKSLIIEGSEEALWSCVKYVELNAVRAGIVNDPADYRFCSWGRYRGSGVHPFHANFIKHIRATVESHRGRNLDSPVSDDDIFCEFAEQMTRIIVHESGGTTEEVEEAGKEARKKESMPVRFLRRTRHWSDGAIIGSKAFVQEMGCRFDDKQRVMKKQLSQGKTISGASLHCFRRLRI